MLNCLFVLSLNKGDIKISFIFCSSFSLISFKLCADPIILNLFLNEKNLELNFLLEEEI